VKPAALAKRARRGASASSTHVTALLEVPKSNPTLLQLTSDIGPGVQVLWQASSGRGRAQRFERFFFGHELRAVSHHFRLRRSPARMRTERAPERERHGRARAAPGLRAFSGAAPCFVPSPRSARRFVPDCSDDVLVECGQIIVRKFAERLPWHRGPERVWRRAKRLVNVETPLNTRCELPELEFHGAPVDTRSLQASPSSGA
jgi:hypothetical protein